MTLDIKNWKNCFPFPEPREDQEKCIQFALEQFFIHDKDYVVIEAGLGIGKSAIGMTIANFFNSHLQEVEQLPTTDPEEFTAGSYSLTSQKILQEQYLRDFSDAPCELRTIISSANFSCSGRPGSTCADSLRVYSALKGKFPAAPQKHCKQFCPYKQQKREFLQGLNGITNYPYFLAETMYAGQLKPRNLLIVDEAHNIEAAVGKFVELRITEKFAKSVLNLTIPSTKKIDDMFEWLSKKYEPALQKCIKKLVKDIEKADESKAVEYSKKLETLDKHICKIHRLQKTWSPLNWIINVDDSSGLFWDFKPVDVSLWTEDLLFRFGKKKLLLSATILDYDYYCKSTGIPKDKTAFISIDSPFKPANKPIIYVPTGKMSYAEIDKTLPHLADMVREILKSHQGEKGIIHSVNFRIAEYIMNNVKDSRLLVQKKGMDRNELLQKHIESSEPTVLVSPSMTEGVDLKDDLSRFQVFCKIPFPVLTDEVVKRKMAARKEFYGYTTAQSIIQAVGRSVRSESDWAVTYILDSCAKDFFRNNSHYFPPSFSNSVMNLGNEKLF